MLKPVNGANPRVVHYAEDLDVSWDQMLDAVDLRVGGLGSHALRLSSPWLREAFTKYDISSPFNFACRNWSFLGYGGVYMQVYNDSTDCCRSFAKTGTMKVSNT